MGPASWMWPGTRLCRPGVRGQAASQIWTRIHCVCGGGLRFHLVGGGGAANGPTDMGTVPEVSRCATRTARPGHGSATERAAVSGYFKVLRLLHAVSYLMPVLRPLRMGENARFRLGKAGRMTASSGTTARLCPRPPPSPPSPTQRTPLNCLSRLRCGSAGAMRPRRGYRAPRLT